jgi:hypothetical protein
MVSTVERVHPMPETDPQSSKVRPQVAGVRVAVVELATLNEQVLSDGAEHGRGESANDDGDRLRVKIPAETLKLRREQGHVGMVHLEGGVSAPATCATHSTMGILDLVESLLCSVLPSSQGSGSHKANLHGSGGDLSVELVQPLPGRPSRLRLRLHDPNQLRHGCGRRPRERPQPVQSDLEQLRVYIQGVADASSGEARAIIESAGMNVRRPGLRDKQALNVKAGPVTGSVVVGAKAAADRATYEWQYSKVGEPWLDVEPTRQARKALHGLAAGSTYRFRVRSVTRAGRGDFGEIASVWVT